LNGISDGFANTSIALGAGFAKGVEGTWSFLTSLTTKEGWVNLGEGFKNTALLSCMTCPEGVFLRSVITNNTINYIGNIPNMSSTEISFDLGYGIEKLVEAAIVRRVIPLPKSLFGLKKVGSASRFTTIQSISTYGKWGKFISRKFTIPYSFTLDKATFFNRNFLIPTGRIITVGQFQYIQK
jgi:hypothetical protein